MASSRFVVAVLAALAAADLALADVYMQSPRGANGRNAERNVNRNNANRLYDTQNNAKGGYAVDRAVGGPQPATAERADGERPMYYYEGEKVPITWTAQHGSGAGSNVDGQIIFQFASTDTLDPKGTFNSGANIGTPRNGIPRDANDAATDRIPENAADATASTVETRRFGMHESYAYYNRYSHTEREKGLFTADQNLNRNDARGTRQNPNGNRNGLEIPEERDYYPWSNPSPWSDIAVLDMKYSKEKETYFQQNSHVVPKGLCVHPQMENQQKFQQRDWPNNEADCQRVAGASWNAVLYNEDYENPDPIGPMPIVATLAGSTSNHLGTGEGYNIAAAGGAKAAAAKARELCLQPPTMLAQLKASCPQRINQQACETPIDENTPTGCAWHASTNAQNENGAPILAAGKCRAAHQFLAPKPGRSGPGTCAQLNAVGTGTFYDDQMRYFDDNAGNSPTGSTFYWSIPFGIASEGTKNTVLRMRYNISTHDFPAYKAGNNYLDNSVFNAAPGVDSKFNCQGNQNQANQPCSTVSPVTQDPYVQVRTGDGQGAGNAILSLAVNTNQFARTFQDRTHVFMIKARPTELLGAQPKVIVGLTVKGKRGNIVQTYPAVEYDFFPKHLVVAENSQVHIQWTGSDYNPQRGCNNGEGGPPDCNGCTTLAQANQAANQNSRADRTNLVPMGSNGRNFPMGATGAEVDLYSATDLMAGTGTQTNLHPFSSAWGVDIGKTGTAAASVKTQTTPNEVLWNLMYINQEEELKEKFGAAATCLSQTELDNINNKNSRENRPQNCAKLNGKAHPYFDAGIVTIKSNTGATAASNGVKARGKTYSFFSSRNNNFSNRDQTMDICVYSQGDPDHEGCSGEVDPKSGQPLATYNAFATSDSQNTPPAIDGIPSKVVGGDPQGDVLDGETTAPIEKDNDSVGDGEPEACEARIHEFVSSVGVAGMIAIACAVFVLGIMGTLLAQALFARFSRKPSWKDQSGQRV